MFALSGFGDEISSDLGEQLDVMKDLRVPGLDLRTAFGKNVMALTDDEVDEVGRQVAARGMKVQAIGSPINKLGFAESSAEAELVKLKRAIEIAKRLGTQRIRIFSPQTTPMDTADMWPQVKAWMGAQAELAAEQDMILMHENDGHFFGAFPANAKLMLEELHSPHFKAIYDPGNAVLIGTRTFKDWFPWYLPYLDTIHVKDAVEKDHQFAFAGEGQGEIGDLLLFLVAKKWSGTLTLEPHAKVAGPSGGFSGTESFGHAVAAIRYLAMQAGVEV